MYDESDADGFIDDEDLNGAVAEDVMAAEMEATVGGEKEDFFVLTTAEMEIEGAGAITHSHSPVKQGKKKKKKTGAGAAETETALNLYNTSKAFLDASFSSLMSSISSFPPECLPVLAAASAPKTIKIKVPNNLTDSRKVRVSNPLAPPEKVDITVPNDLNPGDVWVHTFAAGDPGVPEEMGEDEPIRFTKVGKVLLLA